MYVWNSPYTQITKKKKTYIKHIKHNDHHSGDYYRKSAFIPFIDSVIHTIQKRLLNHKTILECFLPNNPYFSYVKMKDSLSIWLYFSYTKIVRICIPWTLIVILLKLFTQLNVSSLIYRKMCYIKSIRDSLRFWIIKKYSFGFL